MTAPTQAPAAQVYQLFIRATPEHIWEAITRPEFTSRYFYGTHVETTAEVGSPFRYHSPDRSALWGDETVLEADPPRLLVVTWRSLFDPRTADEPASRVTWRIAPQEGGICKLTVIHDGLDESPRTAEQVSGEGWMMVLSDLKTLLETGEPLSPPAPGAG